MSPVGDIVACGLELRPHEREVLVAGVPVELTSREFEILARLAEHPGWVFSADQLAEDSDAREYSAESVSVHMSRLRHKLSATGAPDAVETVRGFGYRLRAGDADETAAEVAGGVDRSLRDALWQLSEAVHEVEHAGGPAQRLSATDSLERSRREIYAILAK